MFIYHGWVEIMHKLYEEEWLSGKTGYLVYRSILLDIVTKLRQISAHKFDIDDADMKFVDGSNGMMAIHLSGCKNHYAFGVEQLLHWFSENAPGSQGLVFITDSEVNNMANVYKVLRLHNGHVSTMEDIYFSPIK